MLVTELLLFMAGIRVVYRVFEARRTVSVTGQVPDMFPVVVVYPNGASSGRRAAVVWERDLAAFLEAHPGHSFRIPAGDVAGLRAEVEGDTRALGASTSRFWFATFKVRTRDDGVQEIEAVGTGDDDYENRSWYEVHGESLTAMRHLHYFGPGVAMVAGVPLLLGTAALTLTVWYAGWLTYRVRKGRGRPRSNAAEAACPYDRDSGRAG